MTADIVLWVYVILLVAGGLFGFFKAKSRASLISSVVFGALLAMCAADVVFKEYMAYVFLAALLVVFGIRLTKTKKFMPSGMLMVITLIALVLYGVLPGKGA